MSVRDLLGRVMAAFPLAADEDEFDPFAPLPSDPEPGEAEGDDRVHAPGATPPSAAEPAGPEATAPEERP